MRPDKQHAAEAQAIDWVIRQRDPAFADWDDFANWLAEDPEHSAVYDAVASLDEDLDSLPPVRKTVFAPAPEQRRRLSRRAWFGGAVAAALALVVGMNGPAFFGDTGRIQTAAGEHRTIELADGSRIELNGASIIELDEDRPRFARLESGEAMFHVVHRDDAPFVVEAGEAKIVDLGTAFNVVRGRRRTSVAVSEGVVAYNPDRQNVRLTAGQGLDVGDGDSDAPVVRSVDTATVGGWRNGLLVYNDTPLAVVAEDLARTAGMQVTVAPDAADLSFRGALIIDPDRARTIADLAALSGTRARKKGDGWELAR
jgi:transmembrane sensor